jgi:biopolymer transport protein ExbB/biopolymer transport protein TolQ
MFLQEGGGDVGFSPMQLWTNMGLFAKGIVVILFIMSIWSLAVMIDRYLYYSAARKQSREFAPKVAGALKTRRSRSLTAPRSRTSLRL